ncbi:MAG: type II toxin-antitoxin system Phd/YefM family antitoxin [Planctomycetota bacterium]
MLKPTDVHPITEFKRSTPEFVKRLRATGRPEVLTVDGRGEIVVQAADAYERLLEMVECAEAIAGIRRGMEDVRAGRTMTLEQFEERLRKRIRSGGRG